MYTIKSIVCLQLISLIIAKNAYNDHRLSKSPEDKDTIIEPLELILRSTDTEGIFYCNGRVDLHKQQNKLVASIDNPILTSPKFLLRTEQMNSTTIRIRIKPNGYIGVNRISCHWSNNLTYGQSADLIIGANPGIIQLKERCLAYDRRYVQCIFRAPIIGPAFRNGFPRLYNFSYLNPESISYRSSPVLVNITDDNDLVFHFEPRERNIIPKKILMSVDMTLSKFGSSEYLFNIEPVHTTHVQFQIEDISNTKFTIRINHNNTGTISQRLCSGHIDQIDDQNMSATVQDIAETSDQKVLINRLRPSTQYEICLHCFYEQTDQSYKEEKCDRTRTTPRKLLIWFVIFGIAAGLIVLVLIGIFLCRRNECSKSGIKLPLEQPSSISSSNITKSSDSEIVDVSSRMKEMQDSSVAHIPTSRYDSEPTERDFFIPSDDTTHDVVTVQSQHGSYQSIGKLMAELTDENKVAPDTYDVPRQKNA